jgi:5-methylcytosine-specific restriction endonuclease McrA
MNTLVCRTCKQQKPPEAFHCDKTKKTGHSTQCKECYSAYYAVYYQITQEEQIAYAEHWRQENPEKLLAYRRTNQAMLNAKNRLYHAKNRQRINKRRAQRYSTHRDEEIARTIRYYRNHPEKKRAIAQRHHARKAAAPRNDLTEAQWALIKAHMGYRCVYCNKKLQNLTQDHLTPFANGGSHTLWNVLPACASCNSKKGIKGPLCPVQPLLC